MAPTMFVNICNATNMTGKTLEMITAAFVTTFLLLSFLSFFGIIKLDQIKQKDSMFKPPKMMLNFESIFNPKKVRKTSNESNNNNNNNNDSNDTFPRNNRLKGLITKAHKTFLLAMNGTEGDGWKRVGTNNKTGLETYRYDIFNSPTSLFRGEKIIPYSINILFNAILDTQCRYFLSDGQMMNTGILEILDDNTKIDFEEYKSPAPFILGREFVYVHCIHKEMDGTCISFGTSVEHDKKPKTDKYIRGILHISGWAFKTVPNETNKTRVIYLVRSDPSGTLPSWVINQIGKRIPNTVDRLHTYLNNLGDKISKFDKPLPSILLNNNDNIPDEMDDSKDDIEFSDDDETKNDGTLWKGYPVLTKQQLNRMTNILNENNGKLYSSNEYKDIIPKNKSWIYSKLTPLIGGTLKQHNILINEFEVPKSIDDTYINDVQHSWNIFCEWNKWKNGEQWKTKLIKDELKVYTKKNDDSPIDIIKGEGIIQFSAPMYVKMIRFCVIYLFQIE